MKIPERRGKTKIPERKRRANIAGKREKRKIYGRLIFGESEGRDNRAGEIRTEIRSLFAGDKRKKRLKIAVIGAFLAFFWVIALCSGGTVFASDSRKSAEERLNENIETQLDAIDFGELEKLTEPFSEAIGGGSFAGEVRKILSGEFSAGKSSFFEAFAGMIFGWATGQIPLFLTIGAVAVLGGIITDMKTKTLLSGTSDAVFYAFYTLIILLTLSGVYAVCDMAEGVADSVTKLTEAIMPVLLTLMTALGAGTGATVYRPAAAVFSGGIMQIIGKIVLPLFIVSVVFTIVSNLSENVRLGRLSEFFGSLCARLMAVVFTVFSAFLTVRGITAGVTDGISFRAAKFAARNYVPIIGGFVSDGMDLFIAGTVLIKNAVGAAGVLLLFATVFVPVLKVTVFGLLLKLTASVIEPVADKRVVGFLYGLSKRITVLNAALIAVGAMLLILLSLLTITANNVVGV